MIRLVDINPYDGDGKKDLLLAGNFYEAKPEVGIYDASYGLLLKGDGSGSFSSVPAVKSGIAVKGEVRSIIDVKTKTGSEKVLFLLNNGRPMVYEKR